MSHGWDKQAGQMPVKKEVDFFTSRLILTITVIKAYSTQITSKSSWISPISQLCGRHHSCCESSISFMSHLLKVYMTQNLLLAY